LAVTEYKEIAVALVQVGVLDQDAGHLLRELAGYRNRLVHFYDAVSDHELYDICTMQLGDVEKVLAAMISGFASIPKR